MCIYPINKPFQWWGGFSSLNTVNHAHMEVDTPVEGRLIKDKVQYEHFLFMYCIQAPNKGPERMLFLDILNDIISSCSKDDLFVGGDFNGQDDRMDRNH